MKQHMALSMYEAQDEHTQSHALSICEKMCVKKWMSSSDNWSEMSSICSVFSGSRLSFRIATSVRSLERRSREAMSRARLRRNELVDVVREYIMAVEQAGRSDQ